MRGLALGLMMTVVVGGSAIASPLRIRNGSSVRVVVQGKREVGVGLRPRAGAWRLELASAPNQSADVVDVTEGANGTKWSVDFVDGALVLDEARFVAGHAYRISVRHGSEVLGSALIYLYPPAVASRHKVTFDDAEAGSAGGEDIAISKKPTL